MCVSVLSCGIRVVFAYHHHHQYIKILLVRPSVTDVGVVIL